MSGIVGGINLRSSGLVNNSSAADGAVMTGSGLGSPAGFESPAGGGDYVLLYTHSVSDSTWVFNSGSGVDNSTYSAYMFVLATVFNASNDSKLEVETSDDDGVSYKAATGYHCWNRSIDQDGTSESGSLAGQTALKITTGGFRSGSVQGGLSGTIFVPHNGSESGKTFMTWVVTCQMNSGYDYMTCYGGGNWNSGYQASGGVNAWRFSVTTGDISGTIKLYGYK